MLHVPGYIFPPSEAGQTSLSPQLSSSTIFRTQCIPPYLHLWHFMAFTHPINHNLVATRFVYVCQDAHHHPLQHPYCGPFELLETADNHFNHDINGHQDTVSIDRLKAAYGQMDLQTPSILPQPYQFHLH